MEKKLERVAGSKDVFIELTEGEATKSGPKGKEPSIKTKRRYMGYQESVEWQRIFRKNLLYYNFFGVTYFISIHFEQICSMQISW